MINKINNAELVMVTSTDEIVEYIVDKVEHKIIQTKSLTGNIEYDMTKECEELGCTYYYQKDYLFQIDYVIENILNKILHNDFDGQCAFYCLMYDFELSLGYKK